MNNKRLQAELWNIHAILYWILATQLNGWLQYIAVFMGLVEYIGAGLRTYQSKKEDTRET